MVYYIEQTEGPKAEAATALHNARKAGDYALMVEIYTREVGTPSATAMAEIESGNLCWWIFNAGPNIHHSHDIKCSQIKARPIEGKRFAQECARLATRRHGGTWRTVYEY